MEHPVPLLRCPVCFEPTPARVRRIHAEASWRFESRVCPDCWTERRTELAEMLRAAVAWFRREAVASQAE